MLRIIVLLVSIAAGGVAAWLTMTGGPGPVQTVARMGSTAEPAPVAVPESEEVLIAAMDLEPRRKLAAADLQWQAWPKEMIHDGYITRSGMPDAVELTAGKLVQDAMVAGEPIRQEKLRDPGQGYMSALLSPGKRAVAVQVSAETTAGGFILPGDRVDVLQTTVEQEGEGVTRTVVTNIRVLAIDQHFGEPGAPEVSSVPVAKTATLELDPVQAEIISAASVSGSLSLALRSISDDGDEQVVTQESERTVHIISSGRSLTATTK